MKAQNDNTTQKWKHPKRMQTKAERRKGKQLTRKLVAEFATASLAFIAIAVIYVTMWLASNM